MLTNKGKYGLRAMLHLAENENQGASLIAEIAKKNNMPKKFLDAILLELKNAGLLHSKKGRGGGYALARPAQKIMIGDIVRVLDGPLAPIPCASRTAYRQCNDCRDDTTCPVRSVMLDVRDAIAAILDRTSLADLRTVHASTDVVLIYDI